MVAEKTQGDAEPQLSARLLVVDDDDDIRRALRRVLTRAGAAVHTLSDGLQAVAAVRDERIDVVLLDWKMPHVDGLELLPQIKAAHPDVEVIMMTGSATVDVAVQALKLGAYDFLQKPFANTDVVLAAVGRASERRGLRRRNEQLTSALEAPASFAGLIGASPAIRRVFDLIQNVARWPSTVLITGESGTGKELVARAVHRLSPRKDAPFVPLNCSAMPETLLEAELFGHVKGAFTGASGSRDGLFQAADGGTLFLDEIGDLPVALQAKLLRVLQESEVRKVGSNTSTRVDVRVIAATNVDLAKARTEGRFREDLYYRLDVVAIALPALRDRREDVPLLASYFLRKHTARLQKDVRAISPPAMEALQRHEWRGNVRQLENVVERALVLTRTDVVDTCDLPAEVAEGSAEASAELPSSLADMPLVAARKAALESFDRRYLEMQLVRAQGNVSVAARAADMDRANFRRLLKRYKVDTSRYAATSHDDVDEA